MAYKEIFILTIFVIVTNGQDVQSLAKSNNDFGFNIMQQLSNERTNIFISPISISIALSMLELGCRGETREEIRRVLGYNNETTYTTFPELLNQLSSVPEEFILELANSIYVQSSYDISSEYINGTQEYYSTEVQQVDFLSNPEGTLKKINEWVNNKTNGKIETLFQEPLSTDTRLILLSAIYFKGVWQKTFDLNMTFNGTFYNFGNEKSRTKVPMMAIIDEFQYANLEEKKAKVLNLLYTGGDVSMMIVLPHEINGLENLKSNFSAQDLEDVLDILQTVEVKVALPRFKFEYQREINKDLKALGMNLAFTPFANLSGINDEEILYVNNVIHKSIVEVNELGTEAAAVTGIFITALSAIQEHNSFLANHPFLFYIIHVPTKLILFMGDVKTLE